MDVFSGAVKRKRRTSSSARTASRGHRAELWRSMFVSSWNHVFFTRRVLKWWVALKFTAAVGRDTAEKVHSRVVCLDDNALNTASLSWSLHCGYLQPRKKDIFIMMRGYLWAWWGTHVLGSPPDTHTHSPCLRCIVHLTNYDLSCRLCSLSAKPTGANTCWDKKLIDAFISRLQPVVRHSRETCNTFKQ